MGVTAQRGTFIKSDILAYGIWLCPLCYCIQSPAQRGLLCALMTGMRFSKLIRECLAFEKQVCPKGTIFQVLGQSHMVASWGGGSHSMLYSLPKGETTMMHQGIPGMDLIACCTLCPKGRLQWCTGASLLFVLDTVTALVLLVCCLFCCHDSFLCN